MKTKYLITIYFALFVFFFLLSASNLWIQINNQLINVTFNPPRRIYSFDALAWVLWSTMWYEHIFVWTQAGFDKFGINAWHCSYSPSSEFDFHFAFEGFFKQQITAVSIRNTIKARAAKIRQMHASSEIYSAFVLNKTHELWLKYENKNPTKTQQMKK